MRHCLLPAISLLLTGALAADEAEPLLDRGGAVESQAFLEGVLAPARAEAPETALRVQALLGRMTLKEKVGQMTQLTIAAVTDGEDTAIRINPEKLRKAVVDYGVGSILNVNDAALSRDRWREIIAEIQAMAGKTRLGIPVLYGLDSIHGANYVKGATLFPQPVGMAATWNPRLILEASRVTAAETRAVGVPWNFSPILDVGRQPLWPRLYETFGEDVYLASVMGAAAVRGYQGEDASRPTRVAACLKHYVGYSLPTSGHDRTPALIPEGVLREYFLPPFAAGIKAGALSVMVNSGEVNGVPGHLNGFLLKNVLRGELNFDGVVVSDWEDIKKLVSVHHAAATEKDATREAVLAGIDMSMVPNDCSFSDLLVGLVEEGAVPLSRIDEAVSRILTMKDRLGLFGNPVRGTEAATAIASPESRALALDSARESITLLKNTEQVLPLAPGKRILVTGPTADSLPALNNGWTIVWQGDRAAFYPKDRPTILKAIETRLGPSRVVYAPGATYAEEKDVAAAAEAAKRVDVVVLCLGEIAYAETPGNIDDLTLPEAQLQLARAVLASGKPVVLVLVEGRPRIIRSIADRAKGIVMAYNPGMEGGQAVADVLLGDTNPSGKLPFTYPRYPNALETYDHKGSEDVDTSDSSKGYLPQFDFGYGLSYTAFEYSGLTVEPQALDPQNEVRVAVTVKNVGRRAGAEVVQLFVSAPTASITPPVRRLRRFAKLALDPGASAVVRFRLRQQDLAFIGRELKPITEPGTFRVRIGGLERNLAVR
jgi:beta-glucosidase